MGAGDSIGSGSSISTGLYSIDVMGSIDVYINVCESMGANIINTVCE